MKIQIRLCILIRIFAGYILDSQGCKVFHVHKENWWQQGCANWFESSLGIHVRKRFLSIQFSLVQQASYLEGGPLMWMLPLYLHVNQKSDYDYDMTAPPSITVFLEHIWSFIPIIALDKMLFSNQKYWFFSFLSTKTYVVGTHLKSLCKVLLMSTHNICFCGEIWKYLPDTHSYLDLWITKTKLNQHLQDTLEILSNLL